MFQFPPVEFPPSNFHGNSSDNSKHLELPGNDCPANWALYRNFGADCHRGRARARWTATKLACERDFSTLLSFRFQPFRFPEPPDPFPDDRVKAPLVELMATRCRE